MKTKFLESKHSLKNDNLSALKFNQCIAEKVDLVCQPLFQRFGITHFGHIKIFNNKTMFRVANNQAWTQKYFEREFYNDETLYDMSDLSEEKSRLLLLSGDPQGEHQKILCKDFDIWNALAIYNKFNEYGDFWFFGTSPQNSEAVNFYINKLDILKEFILYFKYKLHEEFSNINSDQLIYSKIKEKSNLNDERERIKYFFKTLDIKSYKINDSLSISPKEFESLFFLVQGKTSKEIARLTGMSSRTIEGYLTILRKKTNCHKKTQLIDLFLSNSTFRYLLKRI